MQKDDFIYVAHMLDLARKAMAKTRGVERRQYDADENLRLALVHLIQTIGEAARRVSPEFCEAHPVVPWNKIVGMRHKVVHDYLDVDYDLVWEVAVVDLPPLAEKLRQLLPPDMDDDSTDARRVPCRGFTLIELMVVVAVIAVLASLLYPVALTAVSRTRAKRAMMELKTLETAIKAFHSVYGRWPAQTGSVADVTFALNNAPVIAELTNNPRSMVFLHFQQSSISTNPANVGCYVDPWLHPYVIALDDSCDNKVWVNAIAITLTNLNGIVTVNSMNFTADVSVAVASWGDRNSSLNVDQGSYLTEDMPCSWQMGRKTK